MYIFNFQDNSEITNFLKSSNKKWDNINKTTFLSKKSMYTVLRKTRKKS